MPKVPVSELKSGMRLLKPVTNPGGMVLLSAGTDLNEEMVDRLQRLDLDGVHIRGNRRPNRPMEAYLSELDTRFARTENEPFMGVLKGLLRDHIAGLYRDHGL